MSISVRCLPSSLSGNACPVVYSDRDKDGKGTSGGREKIQEIRYLRRFLGLSCNFLNSGFCMKSFADNRSKYSGKNLFLQ